MKNSRFFSALGLAILCLQAGVMLVSWVVNAADPQLHIRPILSAEGLRWLFGSFVDNLASPLTVWLILIAMAWGALEASGLLKAVYGLQRPSRLSFRQALGLWLVLFEVAAFVAVSLLLTAVPHALLLSITGHLFPSSFSRGLLPMLAAMALILSLSYGAASGTLDTLGKAYEACLFGFRKWAVLWPIYILATELICSIMFVFYL